MLRRSSLALLIVLALAAFAGSAGAQGTPPCAGVFYDQPTFDDYCQQHGKFIKGVETFDQKVRLALPLIANVFL